MAESNAVKTQLILVYRQYAIHLKQRPGLLVLVDVRMVMLVIRDVIKFYTFQFEYFFIQSMIKS